MRTPQTFPPKSGPGWRLAVGIALITLVVAGCDGSENPLAPYAGERPLTFLRVTQSFSPDVQWVGGRIAAVGINCGEAAGLDSTLVWIRTAGSNEIDSPISINDEFNLDAITKAGGVPTDSLESGVTYTFWIAEQEVLDAGLSGNVVDPFAFADTTIESSYLMLGRSGGGVRVNFEIFRDQSLLSDKYTVRWTPEVEFRRLAIRNHSIGAFTDLLWHVVVPDGEAQGIRPPVVIGEPPPNVIEATEWAGWASGTQILWAVTEEWDRQSFSPRAGGYAFFQIFATNFEE